MICSRSQPLLLCLLCTALGCAAPGRANSDAPVQPGPSPAPVLAINPDQVAVEPAETAPPAAPLPGAAGAAPISAPALPAQRHPAATGMASLPLTEAEMARREFAGLQKLGLSLTGQGDWVAAEIAFRRILASRAAGPAELPAALLGLARVYRRQGALTKAAAIYERFLQDYPADYQVPDALLELGRTHRALGANQLAIARFYSVINSTIKLPGAEGFAHYQQLAKTAQFEIAETNFQMGEFAEAGKFYARLRLLDLAPADRARAHFKSAYSLYLGKNYEGAVTNLRSYLEQWPADEHEPEARYLLSLSLRALGRQQEALEATLQLLRTQQAAGDPKAWAYWQRRTGNQLANDFFQNGDTASALAVYQGLAALATDVNWRLPITYQIALCYERQRLTDLATAAYQSIVDGVTAGNEPAPRPPVSPELAELARMAAWRLNQLRWSDRTDRQLASIFSSGVVPAAHKAPTTPTPIAALPPHHVQPGNASPSSPGL